MSTRRIIIQYLEQYESYFRLKYSAPVYALVKAINPRLKKNLRQEQVMFKNLLKEMSSGALVFDVGASVGNTTETFLQLGAQVIAIEPDPKNLLCLRARFQNNNNVKIAPFAVSDHLGETNLYIQKGGNTLHTLSNKWKSYLESQQNDRWQDPIQFSTKISIPTVTLDQLIQKHGSPFFIKIDVEGLEEQVIKGLTQSVPLLSFEANLPEFLPETLRALDHLAGLEDGLVFNYLVGDTIVLEEFIDLEEMKRILKNTDLRYLDVVCRFTSKNGIITSEEQ